MEMLKWIHEVRELAGRPLDVVREADQAERAAVTAYLALLSCESLRVHYSLRPLDHGRAVFSGSLEAEITQECVVSLEPVASRLSGGFSLELWPQKDLPAVCDGAIEALDDDDEPEAIENSIIDVGRIVLERLADLVDPYPRQPGAAFSWTDDKAATDGSDGPFAGLKKLGRSS